MQCAAGEAGRAEELSAGAGAGGVWGRSCSGLGTVLELHGAGKPRFLPFAHIPSCYGQLSWHPELVRFLSHHQRELAASVQLAVWDS